MLLLLRMLKLLLCYQHYTVLICGTLLQGACLAYANKVLRAGYKGPEGGERKLLCAPGPWNAEESWFLFSSAPAIFPDSDPQQFRLSVSARPRWNEESLLGTCSWRCSWVSSQTRGPAADGAGGGRMADAQREVAVTLKPDLLFYPAQLAAVSQGKTVVLGKEGASVELPCEGSQKGRLFFWKLLDQTRILGHQNNFLTKGRVPCSPTRGGKQWVEWTCWKSVLGSPVFHGG